jgi:hypothetical protein
MKEETTQVTREGFEEIWSVIIVLHSELMYSPYYTYAHHLPQY